MTPEAALLMLDNLTRRVNGNREDHENLKAAIAVLADKLSIDLSGSAAGKEQ